MRGERPRPAPAARPQDLHPRKGFFSLSPYRPPRVGDGGSGFGIGQGLRPERGGAGLLVEVGPMSHSDVFVIGAGPAGLASAYLLTKSGISTTVIEADPTYVGGISRTASYKDFLFDIGGHRFFSKSKEV